jgi:MFS family permease
MAGSHGDVPWGKMVRSRSVWLLWIQYFLMTYPWYLYITWMTIYLLEYRKVSQNMASVYAFFPLAFGGVGCVVSGFMLPHVAKMLGGMDRARRTVGTVGFLMAGALILLHTRIESPLLAMLVLGLASFFNDIVMPCAWGTCMDVGGKYAGTLSGSMNMMGNFAGFVSPFLGGVILQHTGNWNLYLYTFVVSYFFAALCWPFLDSRKTLEGVKT